jgi:DNA polymerase-3 subunit epsilon
MNWLSRFLPGSGPGLSPEQQASLDLAGKLPAPDLARSHYETRYVVVNTETGPADGAGQRLLAVGAVAINRGLIHPDDAFQARLGDSPADALIGLCVSSPSPRWWSSTPLQPAAPSSAPSNSTWAASPPSNGST